MRRSLARLRGACPRLALAWGLVTALAAAADVRAADLLIRNARLLDGTGAPPRAGVSIRITAGRIAAIAPELPAGDAPVLDVGGATVLPGLIDAHVHLGEIPGAGQRHDTGDVQLSLIAQHLAAYVACGVTTVLDAGIAPEPLFEIRKLLAAGNPGPRFLTLGPVFMTPGGFLSPPNPGVATVEEVERKFDQVVRLGGVGASVWLEHGWAGFPRWPIHGPELRDAIVRGAARRRLPVYAHASSEEDQAIALDMGAHAIMLSFLYRWMPASDAFAARMARSGAYQATSFAFTDNHLAAFHRHRLEDPLVRLTVPALELETARDPGTRIALARGDVGNILPWLPRFLHAAVAERFLDEDTLRWGLGVSQETVRRLHAGGVPIVVGTDAGGSPYHFHGPTTLREIELLGEVGVAPSEAIAAATRVPAAMLGLAGEIGTVEVGKRADLMVVRDDPLADLAALRTVRWTVQDGVARTPAEWMEVDGVYEPGPVRTWSVRERAAGSAHPTTLKMVVTALLGVPVLVWAVVTRRAWRYLRTHRPEGAVARLLLLTGVFVILHYLVDIVFHLTWAELQWRPMPVLGGLVLLETLTTLAAVALFLHMVRLAPVGATRPSGRWLAINYGAPAAVLAVNAVTMFVPRGSWEIGLIGARAMHFGYLLTAGGLVLWHIGRLARRGAWRPAALGEARSADLVLLAGGVVGVVLLLFLTITGGAISVWGDVVNAALGLILAAPFAVRLLGEVVRALLLTASAIAVTTAVLMGVPALTAGLATPAIVRLIDLGAAVGLALLFLVGQSHLRAAIEYVVFRRSRRHRTELLDTLDALSPEIGTVECCRRAATDVVRVMGLRGAAIMLADGGAVAHGAIALDVLGRAWPRGVAAGAPPAKALVGWYELTELPSAVRQALVEANVVGVVPVASQRRRWGHLLLSTGLVGAAFSDEDLEAVEEFADQLALVLDGADLLARAVAVERSLAHAEKLAAIGELSARIAHEIRNPVTAARSLAQQLARAPAAAADAEPAGLILTELERVERQVAALLRFARREEFRFEPVDLGELARATVETFRTRCEAGGVALEVHAAEGVVARADREKIRQVLINLIENALDAMAAAAGPRSLSVAVGNGDGAATVRVSDTGPGVPADALPRLFEPFFSLKPSGTGLGLAIARRTVEAHGGRIEVDCPAQGMTFRIELPLEPEARAA